MTKKDKVISPAKYELREEYHTLLNSTDKVKAQIVYRERDGYKFFDIVITIKDRVFLVKPWSVYSNKTLNVFKWLLTTQALDLLQDSQETSI